MTLTALYAPPIPMYLLHDPHPVHNLLSSPNTSTNHTHNHRQPTHTPTPISTSTTNIKKKNNKQTNKQTLGVAGPNLTPAPGSCQGLCFSKRSLLYTEGQSPSLSLYVLYLELNSVYCYDIEMVEK